MSAICSFDSLKICFFIDKIIDCVEDCHYFENGLQILVLNVIFFISSEMAPERRIQSDLSVPSVSPLFWIMRRS